MTAEEPTLLILPEDPRWQPAGGEALREVAAGLGLVATDAPPLTGDRLAPGPRFLDAIGFLGCAPNLGLGDEGRGAGLALRVLQGHRGPLLFPPAAGRPPRCPGCGRPQDRTPSELAGPPWSCPDCARRLGPLDLRWRRSGGVASAAIGVTGVHPHEAVPSDTLLAALSELTGVPWRYSYSALPTGEPLEISC